MFELTFKKRGGSIIFFIWFGIVISCWVNQFVPYLGQIINFISKII